MADINLERVKQYNMECNAYRQKLSQIKAERKILMDNITSQCEQLSKQLGVEVTIDNIEKIYQDRASSIENILEAGEGILRRIKNSGEASGQPGQVGQTGQVGQAGVTEQVGMPGQTGAQGQVGQNMMPGVNSTGAVGIEGLPVSNYKMPANLVGGKAEGTNPFIAQSIFSGNMQSINVAQADTELLGVDEI